MNANTTLGEIKQRCTELSGKYGDKCCEQCEFTDMNCCDPPEHWQIEGEAQPQLATRDYKEAYYHLIEDYDRSRAKCCELGELNAHLTEENKKLRTALKVIEFMVGRKLDI